MARFPPDLCKACSMPAGLLQGSGGATVGEGDLARLAAQVELLRRKKAALSLRTDGYLAAPAMLPQNLPSQPAVGHPFPCPRPTISV